MSGFITRVIIAAQSIFFPYKCASLWCYYKIINKRRILIKNEPPKYAGFQNHVCSAWCEMSDQYQCPLYITQWLSERGNDLISWSQILVLPETRTSGFLFPNPCRCHSFSATRGPRPCDAILWKLHKNLKNWPASHLYSHGKIIWERVTEVHFSP